MGISWHSGKIGRNIPRATRAGQGMRSLFARGVARGLGFVAARRASGRGAPALATLTGIENCKLQIANCKFSESPDGAWAQQRPKTNPPWPARSLPADSLSTPRRNRPLAAAFLQNPIGVSRFQTLGRAAGSTHAEMRGGRIGLRSTGSPPRGLGSTLPDVERRAYETRAS